MKIFRFLAFLLIVFNFSLLSQSFWNQLDGPYGCFGHPSYAIDSINNIYFASTNLYRSTNYGDNWVKIETPFNSINSVSFHPNGYIFLSADEDVYRSTNGGLNWVNVLPNSYSAFIFLINNLGYIFAGSGIDGLYMSTNNGINWIRKLADEDVRSIAKSSNGKLYAGLLWGGLYKSSDNGFNWSQIAFNSTSIYSIVINTYNIIYVCAEGTIYKSLDEGVSWIPSNYGLINYQDSKLFIDKDDYLYCANGYGVFKSTNKGNSWFNTTNDLGDQRVTSFIQCNNGYLFAGSSGKAVNRTINNGLNWTLNNSGIINSYIQSIYCINSNYIITGVHESGIFYSSNAGANWNASNLQTSEEFTEYKEFSEDNFGKLFTGVNNKLYSSVDSGRTWNYLSAPSNCEIVNIVFAADNTIFLNSHGCALRKSTDGGLNWSILPIGGGNGVLGKNFNGDLYFTNFNSIYRSTNNGLNWISLPPLPTNWTQCLAFDSSYSIYLGFDRGIFYSSNNGQNWVQIFSTLTLFVTNVIVTANYIYALPYEDRCIYYSTNHGLSWNTLGSGLENQYASVLSRDISGTLYCGTFYHGIFKGLESLISVSSISNFVPKRYQLYYNYPNPFNPHTVIKFDVGAESIIKIKIYNSVGQIIDILVDENLKPGQYEITWFAEKYPSGIYYCNMQSEVFNQTRKLVLIK